MHRSDKQNAFVIADRSTGRHSAAGARLLRMLYSILFVRLDLDI